MKTVLGTLSVMNALMGVGLLGLFVASEDVPPVVVAIGLGLLIQAGYTLAYMAGRLDSFAPWSLRALIVGQTVAVVVGAVGFLTSAVYNINPPGGDPEYEPLTVGALISFQASVALWIYAQPSRSRVRV